MSAGGEVGVPAAGGDAESVRVRALLNPRGGEHGVEGVVVPWEGARRQLADDDCVGGGGGILRG